MHGKPLYAVLAVVFAVWNTPAHAGVIHWGLSSGGAADNGYSVDGKGFTEFQTASGQSERIDVIAGFHSPGLVSPIPVEGPTLNTLVTITDIASGVSGSINVPVIFYDNETAPDGEIDFHIARLGIFDPQGLDMGDNHYSVTSDGERVTVTVSPIALGTPEPTTLALASIGIATMGWRRFGRSRLSAE